MPTLLSPTPLKIIKNFQGTMSTVGHGIIKKTPGHLQTFRGFKEVSLKEKQ